ncbi:MAG: hypothetical protein WC730_01610 [Patescibacteria group bacterium]
MQRSDARKNEAVMNYLLEPSGYDQVLRVLEKFKLGEELVGEALMICGDVVSGTIGIEDLPTEIEKGLKVDRKISKKLALDLAGYRLLPLLHYLPDVAKTILAWGGKVEDYPDLRIRDEKETPEYKVKKMAEEMGLELPEELMDRFVYLATGYFKKSRTKEATEKILRRSFDIGGLEFSDVEVNGFFTALDTLASLPEISVEVKEEKVPEVVRPIEEKKIVPIMVPVEEKKNLIEKEIIVKKEEAKVMPSIPVIVSEIKTPFADQLPTGIVSVPAKKKEEVLEKLTVLPARVQEMKPTIQKKEQVIEKIEEKKEEVVPLHPMGPESREPAIVMRIERKMEKKPEKESKKIETPRQATPKSKALSIKSENHLATTVPVISKPSIEEPSTDGVREALQPAMAISKKNGIKKKDFDAVVNAHVRGIRDPHQTERLLSEKLNLEGEDLASMMKALEEAKRVKHGDQKKEHHFITPKITPPTPKTISPTTRLPSSQPVYRVSAARPAKEEQEIREEKKIALAALQPRVPKANVQLTAASVPPMQGDVRKVADVKFSRALIGPEEELGTMTVTEFRRLSTDPTQAAKKVEDKFALLEEHSYEARVSGVRAWRRSPVYALYIAMTREALEKGKSLTEVASGRRNIGEETLSPAEIKAMIDLHRRIGF